MTRYKPYHGGSSHCLRPFNSYENEKSSSFEKNVDNSYKITDNNYRIIEAYSFIRNYEAQLLITFASSLKRTLANLSDQEYDFIVNLKHFNSLPKPRKVNQVMKENSSKFISYTAEQKNKMFILKESALASVNKLDPKLIENASINEDLIPAAFRKVIK